MVNIIPYEDQYHKEFKKLNLEWLDKYNLTEDHDLMVLDEPIQHVLQKGGYIWLAEYDGKIVGTAALMKVDEETYELAKMCVTESYQGKGISKMLIDACMQKAKALKTKKLLLFSNSQLQKAIKLYKSYGFKHIKVEHSPFETADIKMECVLN